MDPGMWIQTIHKKGDYDYKKAARARAICKGCKVRQPCLEYALSQGGWLLGIWGGKSLKQRKAIGFTVGQPVDNSAKPVDNCP